MSRGDIARLVAGLLVSAAFLSVTLTNTNTQRLWLGLAGLSIPFLLAALCTSFLEITVRAARWRSLLAPTVAIPFGMSFAYICVGHFANSLLPFRLGDAARAYLTGGRFRASRMTVFGTILVERAADGLWLLGVLVVGTVVGTQVVGTSALLPIALAIVGLAVCAGIFLARRSISFVLTARVPRIADQIRALTAGFESVHGLRRGAVLVATTASSFLLAVVIMRFALLAVGVSVGLWPTAIAISAMTLSTAIPAGPAALGTYEFAGTTALIAFGVPPHAALAAVILVHVLATLPPALIGLVTTLVLHFDVLALRSRGRNQREPHSVFGQSGTA